ncbi:MAG: molecular chaperone DnaK [Halioglobus sp.]|jgi:molecular chaperone DnaK
MSYSLGIDLGTTFTAAAVYENGQARIIDLSDQSATMPSIIYLDENGSYLVGDSAMRRASTEPARAAQQFKRRFGDTAPIFIGGAPLSADALTAELLKSVIVLVSERQGGPPDAITLTHPANWGGYKLELFDQTVRRAGLDSVINITEPEAAVLHYAQLERVPNNSLIAVFDLGGGTFDAAIVRKTDAGTEFIGRPEGIDRLGGIDFDQAIYAFVAGHLDGAIEELDLDNATNRAAIERLHRECVDAKVGLSLDEAVSIPVLLPSTQTTIRITRVEFEGLIRPVLTQAIDALQRALSSAGITPEELHAVLLAGGSSRIPLVSELVANELGRPVAVDAHPKQVVALGAAYAAHLATESARAGGAVAGASAGAAVAATAVAATAVAAIVAPSVSEPAAVATERPATPPPSRDDDKSKLPLIIGALAAVILTVGAIVVFAVGGGGDTDDAAGATTPTTDAAAGVTTPAVPATTTAPATTAVPATTAAATTTATTATTTTTTTTTTTLPFPAATRRVELTSILNNAGTYEVAYETTNFEPTFSAGQFHMHFHWNTFTPESVGTASNPRGDWQVWDLRGDGEKIFDGFNSGSEPAGATAICAVVATDGHAVDAPEFVADTVSCLDLPA